MLYGVEVTRYDMDGATEPEVTTFTVEADCFTDAVAAAEAVMPYQKGLEDRTVSPITPVAKS